MFESDQHEFDEEYEGYRHPAPPSPPQPVPPSTPPLAGVPASPPSAAPAEAQAASATPSAAAVEEPVFEKPEDEPQQGDEEEPGEHGYEEESEFVEPEQGQARPPAKKKPNLVVIAGFAALIAFAIVAFVLIRPKQNIPPPGDMGPGIVAADGLRGHLETRWEGDEKTGKLAYQLRIEPMEDRWQAGFSRVALNPPMPMSVNVRLLDSSGFALCGKEIDFRFDPQNVIVKVLLPATGANGKKMSAAERSGAISEARQGEISRLQAEEVSRERGKDIFQNQLTDDGLVSAVNVQGILPCSPDQYRRADYWDLNTNFPTLDQQALLLDPKAAQLAKSEYAPPAHPGKRTLSRIPQEGFVIQGDDRVTGYDSASGTLLTDGKTFHIDKRFGQPTAMTWANNYVLIHYRCDQQSDCSLTAAGEAAVLHARLEQ